jgi:hypothetical protein
LLALGEKRKNEVVLRPKMAVEGRPGDSGTLDHLVDGDGTDASPREELVRAVENALAGAPPVYRYRAFRHGMGVYPGFRPCRQNVLSL